MALLTPSKVLGIRVKEHRELHGMTQAQLAARLTKTLEWRIDRTMVARIEAADRQVNVDELFKLAAALDTTPALLLTPADESALMLPTPWRAMTSNRVRAWIADSVPLWEQNREAYEISTARAWALSEASHEEMHRLLKRIASLHGVESIDDIDVSTELGPKDQAEVDLIDLRIEITRRRYDWETRVGEWNLPHVAAGLDRLEADPVAVAAVAATLWPHPPLVEVHERQDRSRPADITTAEQAADRIRALVEALSDVVDELVTAVGDPPPPSARVRELPKPRDKGEGPA